MQPREGLLPNLTDCSSVKGANTMLRTSMRNAALLVGVVIGTVTLGLARSAPAASQNDADVAAKIENAMSAAPSAISANATILDYEQDAAGTFVVLRDGSNDWSCFPDLPSTPTNDPQCNDQTWMDWTYALFAGEEPNTTVPGLAYMLQGESAASSTDPLATEPPAGEEWMTTPAHVMMLLPGDLA